MGCEGLCSFLSQERGLGKKPGEESKGGGETLTVSNELQEETWEPAREGSPEAAAGSTWIQQAAKKISKFV